jgi:hypothetical protein
MIYFIRAGRKRLVKIGYSKGHPSIRLKTLQTGSIEPLELIGMLDGDPRDEAEWHRRFRHLRVTGEWFRWTSELSSAAKPYLRSTAERRFEKSLREWKALADKLPSLRIAVARIEDRLGAEEVERLNNGE